MSHFRTFEEKCFSLDILAEKVACLKSAGKRIATLNGSFDLMHAGHLFILKEAALQADILVVALNSDSSIRQYKGEKRPIVSLPFRLQLMGALEMVDFVTWFDELTPCKVIEALRPDVHVNGIEYGANCVEAAIVRQIGARLHLVERIDGLATSEIIGKIKCV